MKLNVFVILGIIALFVMPISAVSMEDIRAEGTVSNLTINQTIIGQMNQTPNMTPGPQGIPGINGTNGLNGTPGTTDHHLLTNLTTFDDHTQYLNLSGRSGGQTITGPLNIGRSDLISLPTTYLSFSNLGSGSLQMFMNRGSLVIDVNHTGDQIGSRLFLNPSGGNVTIGGFSTPNSAQLVTTGPVRFMNYLAGLAAFDSGGNLSSTTNLPQLTSLDVKGTSTFERSDAISNLQIKDIGGGSLQMVADSPLVIEANQNLILQAATSNGQVSIGTYVPTAQFDTTGTVRFRNFGTGITTFNSTGVISSQSYLTGTKTYYVSDTLGGLATRKLTFTNGILTAET